MKKWLCTICGLIYDEAKGWPSEGIPAGTRWEDVPDDWLCPDCGVGKADFEMIELKTDDKPAAAPAPAPVAKAPLPIVIVGSGYAGYSLAEAVRQRNPDTPLVVVTADDGHHYSKPALSNALARSKSADDLVNETPLAMEQRLNIRIYTRCRVRSIDTASKTLATDAGSLEYGKLVLALGADPIRLPLAGSCAEDVLSVNDLQDYRRMRERLQGCEKVTIIGNGLIGCEFANDLVMAGHHVDVVGLDESPMSRLLPPEIGSRLQQALQEQGVHWYQGNTVERVEREGGRYRAFLRDGTELVTDLVISAVGLRPRTELAQAIGAEVNRGIRVNGGMRTNVPDVFAIGDCVEINGQLLPYIAPINHGIRALADTLLGRPTMVQYPLMPVIVKTPTLPLTVLTPSADVSGRWQVESEEQGARALFVDDSEQLQGFVLAEDCVSERQYWLDRCGQPLQCSVA
ncbi:MAG: FAD-dependent oxidoreductase [Marinobacter sp.]|uniref:FAD-dependent oxidoreductase n=1 Tax=Marinobacter sp. TaxID=50741 RepID=UPI00299E2644|nr:FAD-dependent oxidoreductase [Marinobacter sp.]MDX1755494.1 FAD-dependent oxidoreductase [Marinobacter sp.]